MVLFPVLVEAWGKCHINSAVPALMLLGVWKAQRFAPYVDTGHSALFPPKNTREYGVLTFFSESVSAH